MDIVLSPIAGFSIVVMLSLGWAYFCTLFWQKSWLYICVVTLICFSVLLSPYVVEIAGFKVSLGTPLFAGIFLATDALAEFHGKKSAFGIVAIAAAVYVLLVSLTQVALLIPPATGNSLAASFTDIYGLYPQMLIGSLIAFVVSQNIDIVIYTKIREWTGDKFLYLRNNISTITAQFIDTALLTIITYTGSLISSDIAELIITAWLFKVMVAIADTGFLYHLRWLQQRRQKRMQQLKGIAFVTAA